MYYSVFYVNNILYFDCKISGICQNNITTLPYTTATSYCCIAFQLDVVHLFYFLFWSILKKKKIC